MVLRRVSLTQASYRPVFTVWELTLRCDQPCTHCGSRAGDARPGELSTEEALDVVRQLAAMGTREVALIGGEAYLHPGFLEIIAAVKSAGMRPSMTTGGRGIDAPLARAMADAGLYLASVSLDGMAATHDLMRAVRGSFDSATAALVHLRAAGVRVGSNINVNRLNMGDLEALYEHLVAHGVSAWQVQITAPLGRAADRPEMILQPWDLLDVVPRVAALKARAFTQGMLLMPGNNLGFFGPEEAALRSVTPDGADHFAGCQAGRLTMGIEADGAVKGCPSLQPHYIGGNLRERPIEALWRDAPQLAFARARTEEDLWGFCATCPFARACMGGCSFTAHSLFGRTGNNPYCHFRARTLAARGVRERLVLRAPAPGTPFDHATFEAVEEPLDAPDPRPERPHQLVQVRRKPVAPGPA